MFFKFIVATILLLNVAIHARVIDTEEEIISTNGKVTKTFSITEKIIPSPIEKPVILIPRCPLGKGEVSYQKSECTRKNGRFFKKFYNYPQCYSDFVCLIPSPEIYHPKIDTRVIITKTETSTITPNIDLSNCITISGIKYCSADISNITSCQFGKNNYDFKKCILNASEKLSDLKNLIFKQGIPIITSKPSVKPLTIGTTVVENNSTKTSKTIPTKTIPTPKPTTSCAKGILFDMTKEADCQKRNGKFYLKFHQYPICDFDYVCFIPAVDEDPESSTCVYIDGKQYCHADITSINACNAYNKDIVPCAKKCKSIFEDFYFEYNVFTPKPYTSVSMSTTLPIIKTESPTITTTTTTDIIISTKTSKTITAKTLLTSPTTIPVIKTTLKTTSTTSDNIIPVTTIPVMMKECPLGKGVVMNQLIDCEKMNGKFYKKFHPYPECYSDYVCFIPAVDEDPESSTCIYIDGKQYCQADISNVKSCKADNKDVVPCAKECKSIFDDFSFEYNVFIPKPYTPVSMSTTLPIMKTESPITTTTMIDKIISTPIEECPSDKDEIKNKSIECKNKYGKFYEYFHPYPDCYSDYVCFLPPVNLTKETVCIYINEKQYCLSDITTIDSCKIESTDYDLLTCAKESKKIFSDLKYKDTPPLPTPFRPIIATTIPVIKTTSITTTTVTTHDNIIPATTIPVMMRECPLGKGVVMNQLIDCEKMNGKFYKKFHPYPECYSDYVCFIPAVDEDPESSTCIYIDGKQYCQADISNVKSCKADNKDVVPCAKECKSIFDDFSFEYNVFIPKPYTPVSMSTIQSLTISPITKPIVEPTAIPSIRECKNGAGEVTLQYIECTKKNGKFYRKFHQYPDCYSDFVCFIPDLSDLLPSLLTKCIYIDNLVYCTADISNIMYCKIGSQNYDFKKCVEESSRLFSDFVYKPILPATTPTVVTKPITITKTSIKPSLTINSTTQIIIKPTVMPLTRVTTPVTTNSIKTATTVTSTTPAILPKPMTQGRCLLGQGDTMLQYIECTQLNGIFYSKGHGYPDCYADFICFIPKLDNNDNSDSTDCINIKDQTYCSVDITNVKYCNKKKNDYDFNKCVEEASHIFVNFSYQSAPNLSLPKVEIKLNDIQATTIVVPEVETKTNDIQATTIVAPELIPNVVKNINDVETVVNVDVGYEIDENETDSSDEEQ